jgi:hypothetical protein
VNPTSIPHGKPDRILPERILRYSGGRNKASWIGKVKSSFKCLVRRLIGTWIRASMKTMNGSGPYGS